MLFQFQNLVRAVEYPATGSLDNSPGIIWGSHYIDDEEDTPNCAGAADRFLFVVGHMMRYGTDVIEATATAEPGAVTASECVELALHFFGRAQGAIRTQSVLHSSCAIVTLPTSLVTEPGVRLHIPPCGRHLPLTVVREALC